MAGKEYFISGIDTDCGKTHITGLLGYHLIKNGVKTITTKLIQTGCSGISEDILEHRKIMEAPLFPEDSNMKTCPFIFSFPASPHLAIQMDNADVDMHIIRRNVEILKGKYEIILSEGVGGLMVPIAQDYLVSDYISDYKIPLILVCSSRLGSINHTLLSLELCRTKNFDLAVVVFNHFPGDDPKIAESSYAYLKQVIRENFKNTDLIHSSSLDKSMDDVFFINNLLIE